MQRRQLPLTEESFVVGDMEAMHGAMKQLGIETPAPSDYPSSLRPSLHRHLWTSTLSAIERTMLEDSGNPVFAKPADRRKSFTGKVFHSIEDFRDIGHLSRRQAVWCSELVEWLSEFRVYVLESEVVGIDCYKGDASVKVDEGVLATALRAYRTAGEAPRAYGIDFGVLSTGQTALIEANDGYSLGAYHIDSRPYTDVLLARWAELMSTRPKVRPAISA